MAWVIFISRYGQLLINKENENYYELFGETKWRKTYEEIFDTLTLLEKRQYRCPVICLEYQCDNFVMFVFVVWDRNDSENVMFPQFLTAVGDYYHHIKNSDPIDTVRTFYERIESVLRPYPKLKKKLKLRIPPCFPTPAVGPPGIE
ncbi:hypothetical protein CHUAL_006856 [Chamberlinius hualienensis]